MTKGFARVIYELFPLPMTPYQFTVLVYLIRKCDLKHQCYPGLENIAKNCKMSVRTALDCTHFLKRKGFLTYKRGYIGRDNQYTLDASLFDTPTK